VEGDSETVKDCAPTKFEVDASIIKRRKFLIVYFYLIQRKERDFLRLFLALRTIIWNFYTSNNEINSYHEI
jgi:hypothetical protein